MDASALETRLKELMGLKKDLEDQVEEQMELLHAQGVGMTDSLVTPDGFPRSDVDLYVVRNARQQIIRLRNDVNGTMAEISRLLEELHSQRRKEAGSKAGAEPVAGHSEAASQAREPKALAIITGVAPGSPADGKFLRGLCSAGSLSHTPLPSLASRRRFEGTVGTSVAASSAFGTHCFRSAKTSFSPSLRSWRPKSGNRVPGQSRRMLIASFLSAWQLS
ncbi:hypothetical protein DFJ74DRAFT_604731 [Hyaloraphidium curvatum]|nr:hypothetical protein DFJ74DRAFT_604731 [Hyaloraphidium curvatum]